MPRQALATFRTEFSDIGVISPGEPLHILSAGLDWLMKNPTIVDRTLRQIANQRLIRSMDALLRAAPAGRGVFLSSGVARNPRPFWGPYAASKAALEALVITYARELSVSAVKVNLLNPGATRTAMRAKAFPGEDPLTLPTPEDVAPLIVKMLSPDYDKNGALVNYRETIKT